MAIQMKNPQVIGDFCLTSFIAKGNFGRVFLGHRLSNTDDTIACKEMDYNADTPESSELKKATIEREIKVLQNLNHENLVHYIDSKHTTGTIYLFMEFCNGGDLKGYIDTCGIKNPNPYLPRLPVESIRLFFSQVANALEYLHSRDVIHRDLKPSNLLLAVPDGANLKDVLPEDVVLKLADFGMARVMQEQDMATTYCGTPLYMAPEVALRGAIGRYDGRCDLWSLGVMMYQCYYGQVPFPASQVDKLRKMYREPDKPEQLFPDRNKIPVDILDLLKKTLKKKPDSRISFFNFFNHRFFSAVGSGSSKHWGSQQPKSLPKHSSSPAARAIPAAKGSPRSAGSDHAGSPFSTSGQYVDARRGWSPASDAVPIHSGHVTIPSGARRGTGLNDSPRSIGQSSSLEESYFHPSSNGPPSMMRVSEVHAGEYNWKYVDGEVGGEYIMVDAIKRDSLPKDRRNSSGSSATPPTRHCQRWSATGTDAMPRQNVPGTSPRTVRQAQHRHSKTSMGSDGPSPAWQHRQQSVDSAQDCSAQDSPGSAGSVPRASYSSPWRRHNTREIEEDTSTMASVSSFLAKYTHALQYSKAAMDMISEHSQQFAIKTKETAADQGSSLGESALAFSVEGKVSLYYLNKKLTQYLLVIMDSFKIEWESNPRKMCQAVSIVTGEMHDIFVSCAQSGDTLLNDLLNGPPVDTSQGCAERDIYQYILDRLGILLPEAKFAGKGEKERLSESLQKVLHLVEYLMDSCSTEKGFVRPQPSKELRQFDVSLGKLKGIVEAAILDVKGSCRSSLGPDADSRQKAL